MPGLPTTPFMLLALWAFSKSSKHFHNWLYNHRIFGPHLQHWHQHRVISVQAKALAIVTMSASFIYLAMFTTINVWIKITIALVMVYGAFYVLSKPSRVTEA